MELPSVDTDLLATASDDEVDLMIVKSWLYMEQAELGVSFPELRNHLVSDLIWLHRIATLAHYLKTNKDKAESVVKMINQLCKKYGHATSIDMLKMALESEGMWIGEITYFSPYSSINFLEGTCLHVACNLGDLDCIKTIFSIAGDRFLDFIAERGTGGITAWHEAVRKNRETIVDLFIDWAKAANKAQDLLALKYGPRELTAFSTAALNGRVAIFKKLIELADTAPSLVKALLMDNTQASMRYCVRKAPFGENRNKIVEIINEYAERYHI